MMGALHTVTQSWLRLSQEAALRLGFTGNLQACVLGDTHTLLSASPHGSLAQTHQPHRPRGTDAQLLGSLGLVWGVACQGLQNIVSFLWAEGV